MFPDRHSDEPEPIRRAASTLVIIDMQERLLPKMHDGQAVITRLGALLDAAQIFRVPTIFTEHCRDSIGPVDAGLRRRAPKAPVVGKCAFRSTAEPEFMSGLESSSRPQVVWAGIEAHVYVLQTALGLTACGYDVFVVEDAVTARNSRDCMCAIERMAQAGIVRITTEMVLFEWCEMGDHPDFVKLLPTIKKIGELG